MYKIGENIHIISPKVKEALTDRDGAFFVDLARRQQAAGRGRPGPEHRAAEEGRPRGGRLAGGRACRRPCPA